MNFACGTPWTSSAAVRAPSPRSSAINLLLVAPSISASCASSSSLSASGNIAGSRSRALGTSLTVSGNASRTNGKASEEWSSEPTAERVNVLPSFQHPRDPALNHCPDWTIAIKDGAAIYQTRPAIRHGIREQEVEGL